MAWQTYKNTGKPLPTTQYNLRSQFGSIENQGQIGACTAFATLQCFAAMRKKQGYPWEIFSPLAEWYMSKKLYGKNHNIPNYVNENQGVTENDALEVLCVDGVMPMQDDPWNAQVMMGNWIKAYQTPPPSGDWITSIKLRRSEVYEIPIPLNSQQPLLDVRDALANGNAVLLSTIVWDNWFNLPPDGIIPMPPSNQAAAGGHEINIIGDDPGNQRLLILNQWGENWGIQDEFELYGCAWLPYEYFLQYTEALYVLIPDASVPPAPTPKPSPNPTPTPNPTPDTKYLQGADVSQFQDNINWNQVSKHIDFALIRAQIGHTDVDANFSTNYENAKRNGVVRGAYQFAYPIYDTATESYAAYKETVLANGGFQIPPIVDVESAGCGNLTKQQVTQWVSEWLAKAISDYGSAILYSNTDFFQSHIDIRQLPKGTLLWVAEYGVENPSVEPWLFWQHTDKGTIEGISGYVDLDAFNGSLDDLKNICVKGEIPMTLQTVHIQLNGKDYALDGYMVNGNTCVPWMVLKEFLPDLQVEFINATPYKTDYAVNFVAQPPKPVDEKPVKATVTLTYADGSTQTL